MYSNKTYLDSVQDIESDAEQPLQDMRARRANNIDPKTRNVVSLWGGGAGPVISTGLDSEAPVAVLTGGIHSGSGG